jgi:hypothetical protein
LTILGKKVAIPMIRYVFAVALFAAMEAMVGADESALSRRYRALADEYETAQQSYFVNLRAATTGAEQRQADKRRPKVEDYAPRFLALAKTNLADPAAFDALAWITTHSPHGREVEEALELLAKDHASEKRLGSVLQNLNASRSPAAETLLRVALQSSPHREVRAQACYSLATFLMAKAQAATHAKAPRKPVTKNPNKKVDESTSDLIVPNRDEAVKLFELLAKDYSDVIVAGRKSYGDLARVSLARLRPRSRGIAGSASGMIDSGYLPIGLEIGMLAPEIVGRDTNDQAMRLSGYRGRVVVLDFWGHW